MGKCIIKLSKKAKNKSSPGKLKKKGSYRRVWVSESAESEGEQVVTRGSGSQSPVVSTAVPADDRFSEESD